jgi:hypothetical protein
MLILRALSADNAGASTSIHSGGWVCVHAPLSQGCQPDIVLQLLHRKRRSKYNIPTLDTIKNGQSRSWGNNPAIYSPMAARKPLNQDI